MRRPLALITVTGALAALAVPSGAAAPTKGTYTVSAPVPFPMSADEPTMDGCWNGEETATKNSREFTFPLTGTFTVTATYNGDWDLYLFDKAGTKLAASESDETTNAGTKPGQERFTYKKAKKGQTATVVVCNWLGEKDATVTWAFAKPKK